jgi:hypothetical protein
MESELRSSGSQDTRTAATWGEPGTRASQVSVLKLQLTLNPLPPSELIRLWEAVQQPYRLSVAYVVRTVQIDSELTTDTRLVSERRFVMGGG